MSTIAVIFFGIAVVINIASLMFYGTVEPAIKGILCTLLLLAYSSYLLLVAQM